MDLLRWAPLASVILVDSNIPILLATPLPTRATRDDCLERWVHDRQRLVADARVLLEILRLYVAIDRRDMIQPGDKFTCSDNLRTGFGVDCGKFEIAT